VSATVGLKPRRVTIRDRGTTPGTWTIADESHRDLGRITEAVGSGFFIYAPRGSRLHGVNFGPYPTLADALYRVSSRMDATCVVSALPTAAPNATALT
jgi:hypothetical protein